MTQKHRGLMGFCIPFFCLIWAFKNTRPTILSSHDAGPSVLLSLSSRGLTLSVLLTCHPAARGPRKNECFCGVLVDHGIQVNRCPVRQHRHYYLSSCAPAQTKAICVAARRLLMTWAPRSSRGVTKEMHAAQWIPACAGMTTAQATERQNKNATRAFY